MEREKRRRQCEARGDGHLKKQARKEERAIFCLSFSIFFSPSNFRTPFSFSSAAVVTTGPTPSTRKEKHPMGGTSDAGPRGVRIMITQKTDAKTSNKMSRIGRIKREREREREEEAAKKGRHQRGEGGIEKREKRNRDGHFLHTGGSCVSFLGYFFSFNEPFILLPPHFSPLLSF